ncbi:MAG: hypothetical protein JRM82_03905, partial [Nitrososphaerota archaeon]|nr:hypothetical protein [Nitrososphaerota archaeon]
MPERKPPKKDPDKTQSVGIDAKPSQDKIANEPSESQESVKNGAQSEASRAAEEATQVSARTRSKIETHVDELDTAVTKADEELVAKEKEIVVAVGGANQAIDSMKKIANSTVEHIESEVNDASTRLEEAFGR